MSILLDRDGELRAVDSREAGVLLLICGHHAVVGLVREAVVVDVEQGGCQRAAAVVALALLLVDADAHTVPLHRVADRGPHCTRTTDPQRLQGCPTARREHMTTSDAIAGEQAAARIDHTIAELGDWRGETLSRVRKLIKEADRDVVEEVKWVKPSNPGGVPTWSHDGIICTGETYKSAVKLTFAKGALLEDPARLFNSSLGGK